MNGPNWKDLQPGLFHPHTPHRFKLASNGVGVAIVGSHYLSVGGGPRSRQLTIVQVCIDPNDGEALFVNAAGLVVPCSPGRDLLAHLRQFGEVEAHSTILGAGRYAKKPHEVDAMKKAGTLQRWVVCRLPLSSGAFFYDQQPEWADYLRREAASVAKQTYESGGPTDFVDWDGNHRSRRWPGMSGEALQHDCLRQAAEHIAPMQAQRLQALKQDAELAAWLKGEWPTPPLFQVAAA